eukprot:gene3578-13657_t
MTIPIQTEAEAFWYLNLTPVQQEAYEQFHAHLKAEGLLLAGHDEPHTLMRFLKARQWDPPRATIMYTTMVKWRLEVDANGIDETFVFEELEDLISVYPHFYHKVDKYGRPVYYELLGKTNCCKMLEHSTEKRILDYHVWAWERLERRILPACTQLCSKPIVTAIVVIDLQGLSLTIVSQLYFQDYYPEHLGQMYIINTPFIFKTIWAFVYPMLEERTRKKIHVIGSDYVKTLKEIIPPENLPAQFGGTSTLDPNFLESEGPWSECAIMKKRPWKPYKEESGPK